ncbi:MAG TPA: hypothetical protein VJH97_01405 [Candidatus Nanoarchaeia archaeon]|nr:hypothetical protein [Candidatus Nanoarchaeia archaeon]
MIPARLMKDLERKGFSLDFPRYGSVEEEILAILAQDNQRLDAAIPILLQEKIDTGAILKKLDGSKKRRFRRLIAIAIQIFKKEGIDSSYLKSSSKSGDISYYHNLFRQAKEAQENEFKEEIHIRKSPNTSKSLGTLFAPAKIRIMGKIFSHEKLSNTELKYFYKAIRPLIHAILDEDMRRYLQIVEDSKKYHE